MMFLSSPRYVCYLSICLSIYWLQARRQLATIRELIRRRKRSRYCFYCCFAVRRCPAGRRRRSRRLFPQHLRVQHVQKAGPRPRAVFVQRRRRNLRHARRRRAPCRGRKKRKKKNIVMNFVWGFVLKVYDAREGKGKGVKATMYLLECTSESPPSGRPPPLPRSWVSASAHRHRHRQG